MQHLLSRADIVRGHGWPYAVYGLYLTANAPGSPPLPGQSFLRSLRPCIGIGLALPALPMDIGSVAQHLSLGSSKEP
jgi:hypothetical protein